MGKTTSETARRIRHLLVGVYLLVIAALPTFAATGPALLASTAWLRVVLLGASPAFFALSYVLVCGGLSRLTLHGLVPGKFPRDLGHRVYGPRRLHALCWTALYYMPPVYHAVLCVPWLKALTFRLFGYRGSLNFTIYPDTWIRDLPLLDIGEGAYIANRATLGTNICLRTGGILVQKIVIGKRSLVGHMTAIALGTTIGDEVDIHAFTAIGAGVRIGDRTRIGAQCLIEQGAAVGSDCRLESCVRIGAKAVIGDGLRLVFGSVVPSGWVLRTQADADRCAPAAPVHAPSAIAC